MSKHVSKKSKAVRKFIGFLNYLESVLLLRYTELNSASLKKQMEQNPIDRIHVGCGLTLLKGWANVLYERNQKYGVLKNIDGAWFLNYNLLKPWPWPKNSVSFIAGAHFIEHLDLNHGLNFAKQAFEVLKPGGVIRLSCPDLETYARHYIEGKNEFFAREEVLKACTFKNAQTPSQIFAAKAYDSGGAHKWFHDYSSLKNMLERAGFTQVKKVNRLEGKTPDLAILELPGREIETVYVEAVKP